MHKIVFNQEKNEYKIKVNIINKAACLIPIFMFCAGLKLLFDMLVNYKNLETLDYIGAAFIVFWTTMVFFMGKGVIKSVTSDLVINQDGITVKSILGKDFIAWSQVEDYGISFIGNSKGTMYYYLYFAKEYQQTKNSKTKKLKGKMIKYTITEYNYSETVNWIVPFCKTFCPISPFICEEEKD